MEFMFFPLWRRAGNDERCTCIINKDGVNLINNGVVVRPLDQLFRVPGHIVTQVIKAKLIIGSECDVGEVGLPPGFRVGLMLINAIHF